SSFAVWDPKRLRASGRDGETVMTEPPSPLTMLLSRHTKRREFMMLLGGAAAAWPLAAWAQQPAEKLPRVGSIQNFRNEKSEAFSQGLREAGYVDGQNMLLETRFYAGVLDRIDEFASELVALKCSVILATAPYAVQAVMKATSTIPIVGIDLES